MPAPQHRAEHDGDRGAGRALCCGVEIEKECSEAAAEHDTGHEITLFRAAQAGRLEGAGGKHSDTEKSQERFGPKQEGCRTTGAADIGQPMAGEGLSPKHVNTVTKAETIAAPPPMMSAVWTGPLVKKPGAMIALKIDITCA